MEAPAEEAPKRSAKKTPTDSTAKAIESCGISWQEMMERLLEIFQDDDINIEQVEDLLLSYNSNPADWKKYAKFDKYKYTRNLVHEGNGKFNLMMLCWTPGTQSTIHDHADAHCFVKVLAGELKETKFFWPHEKISPEGSLVEFEANDIKNNAVTYMSDELGLHRVENPSHGNSAVSLHLYSPPFQSCQVFDQRTGNAKSVPMTFWSKYGVKVSRRIGEAAFEKAD